MLEEFQLLRKLTSILNRETYCMFKIIYQILPSNDKSMFYSISIHRHFFVKKTHAKRKVRTFVTPCEILPGTYCCISIALIHRNEINTLIHCFICFPV